jgi:hypothetical protein
VNQAARGYVDYDRTVGRYSLSPEQVLVLGGREHAGVRRGGIESMVAASMAVDRIAEAFRTGGGMAVG